MASEPLSEKRLAEIRARVEQTTPGPWESEVSAYAPLDSLHVAIRTRDKLPAHPWSPRFVAWMTGAIWPMVGDARPRMQHCPACDRTFYQSREVPIDVRADDDIQADADFIAHAPTDVRDLLADNARLQALDALVEYDIDGQIRVVALQKLGEMQAQLEAAQAHEAQMREVVRLVAQSNPYGSWLPPTNAPAGVVCRWCMERAYSPAQCQHDLECTWRQARALLASSPDDASGNGEVKQP